MLRIAEWWSMVFKLPRDPSPTAVRPFKSRGHVIVNTELQLFSDYSPRGIWLPGLRKSDWFYLLWLKLILLRLKDTANTDWSFKLPRLSFLTLLLFLLYHRFGSYNGDKKRSLNFEWQDFSVPLTEILLKKESSREWEQRSQRSHKLQLTFASCERGLSGLIFSKFNRLMTMLQ